MSSRPSVFITGANRGLGLGLVREFVARGWEVYAGCRRAIEPPELEATRSAGAVRWIEIDVTLDASVRAAAAEVAALCPALDVLINNAGVSPEPRDAGIAGVAPSQVLATLDVNTVGPIRVTQAFLPLLQRSAHARVVNMSSGAGSMTRNSSQRSQLPYCLSKAALNLFTRRVAGELRPHGIVVVSVSPGWVRTDMGGTGAPLAISEAMSALAATIESLAPEHTGQWLDRFGQPSEYAW